MQLIDPREELVPVFKGTWPSMPNNVARARRALLAGLGDAALSDATLDAIGTAVTEVATNSVFHAYVGRRIGQFRITAAIAGDEVEIRVEDDGSGFPEESPVRPGRGLPLVASLAGRVETSSRPGDGTRTTMWFARD